PSRSDTSSIAVGLRMITPPCCERLPTSPLIAIIEARRRRRPILAHRLDGYRALSDRCHDDIGEREKVEDRQTGSPANDVGHNGENCAFQQHRSNRLMLG